MNNTICAERELSGIEVYVADDVNNVGSRRTALAMGRKVDLGKLFQGRRYNLHMELTPLRGKQKEHVQVRDVEYDELSKTILKNLILPMKETEIYISFADVNYVETQYVADGGKR